MSHNHTSVNSVTVMEGIYSLYPAHFNYMCVCVCVTVCARVCDIVSSVCDVHLCLCVVHNTC